MKTTVEISDALLTKVKRKVRNEGTTLRALVEEGLRRVVAEGEAPPRPFRLRRASFRGEGLAEGGNDLSWAAIRDRIYEGRGA